MFGLERDKHRQKPVKPVGIVTSFQPKKTYGGVNGLVVNDMLFCFLSLHFLQTTKPLTTAEVLGETPTDGLPKQPVTFYFGKNFPTDLLARLF